MRRVVVLGGSAAGLLTAILVARRGSEVIVVEREAADVVAQPLDASLSQRGGAPQTVHGHALLARVALELRRSAPDVYEALLARGAWELSLVERMLPSIADRTPRARDDELVLLACRRRLLDTVLFEVAGATRGVELRYGMAVEGLELDERTCHVTGVRVAGGGRLGADVVIDAMGRRTPVPRWLAERSIEPPLEAWDCGLVYFTRHYRIVGEGELPPLNRVFAAGGQLPSLAANWFLGDNRTAMLSLTPLAQDHVLKSVRDPERFDRLARAVPSLQPWLERSEPTTGVFAMGALKNTLRRLVVDSRPVVLGLHLVGDSSCTTNPTLGRGLSFAAAHASRLAQVLDEEPDDHAAAALLIDDFIAREIEPRFRENAQRDRGVTAAMHADLAGTDVPPAPAAPPGTISALELTLAGMRDADLYRTAMRVNMLLDDLSALSDPDVVARVRALLPPAAQPPMAAGPARAELVELLAR